MHFFEYFVNSFAFPLCKCKYQTRFCFCKFQSIQPKDFIKCAFVYMIKYQFTGNFVGFYEHKIVGRHCHL